MRYKKPYTYFASLFCTLCLCPCVSLTLSSRISSCSCPKPPLAVTPLSQTGDCSGVTGALGVPLLNTPKCIFKVISVVKLSPSASQQQPAKWAVLGPVTGFSQQGTWNPSLPLRFDAHPSAVLRTGCVWQVRSIPSLPASRAGVTSAALEEGDGNVLMALCAEGWFFLAAYF